MQKILLCLIFFSGNVLSMTCTYSDGQIPTPALTVGAKDGTLPSMISTFWHETTNGLTSCIGFPRPIDFFTLVNNTVTATTQNLMFEGTSYKIYLTGVKGIGVIMSAADISSDYQPFTSSELILWRSNTANVSPVARSKYRVRFVATERLPAGIISIPPIQIMRHGIYISQYYGWGKITTQSTSINVKYPACHLENPSIVKLPMLLTRDLGGVGTTGGDTPFKIELNCEAGVTDVNVKYTLTDVSSPTNLTSILQLSKASTASGLAMQVLENDVPVKFGPDSSVPGTLNQRDFGKLTDITGRFSKSFIVRYLKTKSQLVPGKVNAAMTITMSYQ